MQDNSKNNQEQPTISERILTFGEDLVGLTFNVGGREDIDYVKRTIAQVADFVENKVNMAERQFQAKVNAFYEQKDRERKEEYDALSEEEKEKFHDRQNQAGHNFTTPTWTPELVREQRMLNFMKGEREQTMHTLLIAQMLGVKALTRLPEVK